MEFLKSLRTSPSMESLQRSLVCRKCSGLLSFAVTDYLKHGDSRELDHTEGRLCEYHASFNEMEAAAKLGCHFCTLIILSGVSASDFDVDIPVVIQFVWDGFIPNTVTIRSEEHRTVLRISFDYPTKLSSESPQLRAIHHVIEASWPKDSPAPTYAYFRPDGQNPNKLSELMRYWLQSCINNHSECRASIPIPTSNSLPKRLLDVGQQGAAAVFLVTTERDATAPYATLSHCWGQGNEADLLPKTTTDNIKAHTQRLLVDELPATFKDAITVTRELGIRYLWIDSLCIVQNDTDDWEQESTNMGQIYANGFVNIAATAASNSSCGLSLGRNLLQVTPFLWEWSNNVGEVNRWTFHPLATNGIASDCYGEHGGSQYALTQRAWVLQETMLSSRILHFLPGQVVWDCTEEFSAECMFTSTYEMTLYNRYSEPTLMECRNILAKSGHEVERIHLDRHIAALPCLHEQRPSLYDLWYDVVREYSSRRISFAKDKLPAIWSLAQRFGFMLSDEYCAGLWRSDLSNGLLFTANPYKASLHGMSERPSAPSWSWASLESGVNFWHSAYVDLGITSWLVDAGIIEVAIQPLNYRAMGRTDRAALTMTCMTCSVKGDLQKPYVEKFTNILACGDMFLHFDTVELAKKYQGCDVASIHVKGYSALLVEVSDLQTGEYRRIGLCNGSKIRCGAGYLALDWKGPRQFTIV